MIGFALQTYQSERSQMVGVIFKYGKLIHIESSSTSMPNMEELLQCQSIKEKELDVLKVIAEDKKVKAIQGESMYRKAKEECHTIHGCSQNKVNNLITLSKLEIDYCC